MRQGSRWTIAITGCALALLAFGAATAGAKSLPGLPGVQRGPAGAKFYHPPKHLPKGKHGSIIWAIPIDAPKGAIAYKVLYVSKTHSGKRVATSGFVVAPKGKAPKGGRPVLAWAHGTEGLADNCAPSQVANPARELVDYFTYVSPFDQDTGVPAIEPFLKKGYVITATDYAGLGTPGIPQYVVNKSETRNLFDSVIAARELKTLNAGRKVVALGWSQGGGAAIAMGEQSGYAKELKLLGTAGLAPSANTGPEFANQTPPGPVTSTSPFHAAAIQLNVFGGFQAAYPELRAADLVSNPEGLAALGGAYTQCINHFAYVINTNIPDPKTLFSPAGLSPPAAWQARATENTDGNTPAVAPILIMQGTADTVVNPNGSTQYVQRACKFPQAVQYSIYPGQTHQTIPYAAKPEYLPWIADRFAGKPAPRNC
jgi:alpha-beta hydrolase superfamily lysophospholipase